MRHRNKTRNLSRTAAHKRAMLANMAASLLTHKRIKTTTAKAKVLRTYIEPIITKSKNDTTHNRRIAFKNLRSKEAVNELFRVVAPKIAERPGGYTRILKIGSRLSDNAQMCYIELVDFNTTYEPKKKVSKKRTRRSRRGGGKGRKKSTEQQQNNEQNQKLKDTTNQQQEQEHKKHQEDQNQQNQNSKNQKEEQKNKEQLNKQGTKNKEDNNKEDNNKE